MVIFQQLFFRRINITGCVIQSLAEQRAGSALRHDKKKKKKNKPRAEQEPRSAHGRAVKKKKPVQSKNRARPMAARLIICKEKITDN